MEPMDIIRAIENSETGYMMTQMDDDGFDYPGDCDNHTIIDFFKDFLCEKIKNDYDLRYELMSELFSLLH